MAESDEEGGCLGYGTALDPYDEDDVPRKKSNYQDVTEQYAYDSNGKRRFHGAFTGGFSAGHFNSVAVPEGWAPQAFKSSRSDRMQLKQNPEDFMDDEDRSEFGIAPRQVHTTKEFSGSKRKRQRQFMDGPIPGEPVLQSLLEAVHETAAIRILKNMGWRPGYGIGEKLTAKEKKKNKKLYTCHIPAEFLKGIRDTSPSKESSESEEIDEDEFESILFEPDDLQPFVVKPKSDCFGLGYSGLSRHSILGYNEKEEKNEEEWKGSHLVTNDKGRKVSIRGQAFGVGALEEEDDDIYAKDDLTRYDFSLDDSAKAKSKAAVKPAPTSSRRILEGFVAALSDCKPSKVYPPPTLPQGYVPKFLKVRKSRFAPLPEDKQFLLRDKGLGRHDLSADDRGKMLGEKSSVTPLVDTSTEIVKPPETKPQTYEERIAAITGRNINFISNADSSKADDKSEEKSVEKPVEVPNEKPINEEELENKGFKPFASNLAKQKRYEKFVVDMESGNKGDKHTDCSDILSDWEKARELTEFQQAYKLYRPLSGLMGDRFVSAADHNISAIEITKPKNSYVSSEKQEAARLGMFGPKTRDKVDWKPDPLLCRRFNIAEPNSAVYSSQHDKNKKPSYSIFEYLENPVHNKDSYLKEQNTLKRYEEITKITTKISDDKKIAEQSEKDKVKINERVSVAQLFQKEIEKRIEEKESSDKDEEPDISEAIDSFNKIDLYKAIFLSESESDNEPEPPEQEEKKAPDISPKNIVRNTSPPRGIFANLNFNKLNSWRNENIITDNTVSVPAKPNPVVKVDDKKQEEMDVEMYGPRLPEKHVFIPKIVKVDTVQVNSSSSDSSDWVEEDQIRDKSKKKSKKAKKSSKKKKEVKSSKHKRKHKSKSKHRK